MSKTTKPKPGTAKTARRREELRRTLPKRTLDLKAIAQRPELVNATLITLAFLAVTSLLVIWAREHVKVDNGQIMAGTRLKRLDYTVEDEDRTEEVRREARDRAPDVYTLKTSVLEAMREPFLNLPVIVAEQADFESINPQAREAYALDQDALSALAAYADERAANDEWVALVGRLLDEVLPRYPLVPTDAWEDGMLQPQLPQLLAPDGRVMANWRDAIQIRSTDDDPQREIELRRALEPVVREAGFPAAVATYVAAGIASNAKATYERNDAATAELAQQRAAAVETIHVEHSKGEVIYRRSDTLSSNQHEDLLTEAAQFAANAPVMERWLPRLGIIGLMAVVATFLVGYIVLFYPRIARNPLRILAICALSAAMLGLTAVVGVTEPDLTYLGAVAPTVFVAMVALLAYDQRIALFLSATQCAVATLALEQGIGMFVLLFAGCGAAVAQLREMRHRNSLIQASAVTGGVLACGAILLGVIETPMVSGAWWQIVCNALWAGFGGLTVGFVVLGILPSLERWFDITTGMTLAELRDPKQPLLKQLQQKAAGTYNHSLQVANIAEAAAEAIGANGLGVYVGALYHDIGKMNKPEYFIENQTDGASKHAKLSPAMSLLVIVGHVKDGIELAREYGLPRPIQHFIESHHGTTLVEYFYQAAKTQAENDERGSVDEIEFRYPGPKPRTKEAAILMLADAVESATRSMADPNPARIESLVRQLSRKRLTDGQYDQCDLTFRELGLIEETVVKSVCAIYHGRISYPSTKAPQPETAHALPPKPVSA